MEKEFTSYEQALALKELGFNEPCLSRNTTFHFDDDFYIFSNGGILYQQAFKWFREKYNITYTIVWKMPKDGNGYRAKIQNGREIFNLGLYTKYEDAEFECLKKLIEIAKKQNKNAD